MRQLRRAVGAALVGVVALVASGCSGGGGGEKIDLQAQGIKWGTSDLQLKADTKYTLAVTNKDGVKHNFTFAEAKANTDVEANKEVKVDFTAPAAGSYKFFCRYHPTQMTQTVTVA